MCSQTASTRIAKKPSICKAARGVTPDRASSAFFGECGRGALAVESDRGVVPLAEPVQDLLSHEAIHQLFVVGERLRWLDGPEPGGFDWLEGECQMQGKGVAGDFGATEQSHHPIFEGSEGSGVSAEARRVQSFERQLQGFCVQ